MQWRGALVAAVGAVSLWPGAAAAQQYDVVVYGATSSGIAAAVQAARMGKSVALIEPTGRIGGMTTNGLSFTDTGNSGAIQGMAREFYTAVGAKYGTSSMVLNFEPKVALNVFESWVNTPNLTLYKNERLDLTAGVTKSDNRISSIRMESGLTFGGSMFIDAGYEGDLMAKAGVSYAVGREANSVYGERYNGIQPTAPGAGNHNFSNPVSAYRIAGDPTSGLLPGINATGPGVSGSGDNRLQAYNYRLTFTKAANRQAWTAPAGYDAADYELVKRYVQANNITKAAGVLFKADSLRGGKYDINNQGGVSTDFIGQNYAYPEGNYETRQAIEAAHRKWQQGFFYFIANDPSMPQSVRDEVNSFGLTADEFLENGGWSDQIYVREARRLLGRYVMTDSNVLSALAVGDSIGLASYTMDSHHAQRYVDAAGNVRNEGNVQAGVPMPFGISYRSITPQEEQASNLLVTAALSASHIAYGSIRMEPVFLTTGQAGGTAAALAIDGNVSVQDLNYALLRQRLIADGALLEWPSNRSEPQPLTLTVDFNGVTPPLPKSLRYTSEGTGFAATTWDGTNTQNVVSGDLTYTRGGYAVQQATGTGAGKLQGTYSAARQNYRDFAGGMEGEIWVSLLVQNPDGDARAGISLNPTTNADPAAGPVLNYLLLDGQTLKAVVGGQAPSNIATLAAGETHLLLMRLVVSVSGQEQLQVWADPADLNALGPAALEVADIELFSYFSRIGVLSYGDADSPGGYVDAIRISNMPDAFFQVTGVPEPTFGAAAMLAMPLLARRRRRRE